MYQMFKAVNWAPNELVGEVKMDTLAGNATWLYNNTPRAIYTLPSGLRRVEGVKIAAGRVLITPKKTDSATAQVRFDGFFSPESEPIITTGVVSTFQYKIHCIINGIGKLQPDHRGFYVGVNVAADVKKYDKISSSFYVTWQALGI